MIEPMRVRDEIIALCREEVEAPWKRRIRAFLIPWKTRRLRLLEVGEGFQWGHNERIAGARFGRYASIGHSGNFSGPVVVGDLSMLSFETIVVGQDHNFRDIDKPTRINFPKDSRPVTVIESDVWIGARVTIMEGINIGRGSVIGSNSIITRDIPPYSLAAGNPAKIIKVRFSSDNQEKYEEFMYGVQNSGS